MNIEPIEHTRHNRNAIQGALARHGKKRKEHTRAGEKLEKEFLELLAKARALDPFPLSSYEIERLTGVSASTVKNRIRDMENPRIKDLQND